MAYLSENSLKDFGFKKLGKNVKISTKAAIYDAKKIEISNNVRIDDFVMLSGNISIGSFSHITPYCLVAGGRQGVFLGKNVTLAYGAKIFSQSDDYTGNSLTNSLIPKKFKKEIFKSVYIGDHVIIGAGSIILPGVKINDGASVGAMSLVTKSIDAWTINYGIPSKKVKVKPKTKFQNLWKKFLNEVKQK